MVFLKGPWWTLVGSCRCQEDGRARQTGVENLRGDTRCMVKLGRVGIGWNEWCLSDERVSFRQT